MTSDDQEYYWVVICKNHKFHRRQNLFYGHKIALAQTDAYAPLPALVAPFEVRCDNCGKEYSYLPSEVMRIRWSPVGPS